METRSSSETRGRPRVALVAHDGKKDEMLAFAEEHREALSRCHLVATSSTGRLLIERVGLPVELMVSGPMGGDLQIGARIVEGEVDALVFLRDPLTAHPHDPDIQALMKACDIHDVPLATNLGSARMLVEGLERAYARRDRPLETP